MTSQRSARTPKGFTLVEVLVAMVIGGMALSATAALFIDLASRDENIRDVAVTADRLGNGEQLLARLLMHADSRASGSVPLIGDSVKLKFSSWCGEAAASMRRCRVDLLITTGSSAVSLVLRLALREGDSAEEVDSLVLRTASSGAIRYLADAGSGGHWVKSWEQAQPPQALAIVLGVDTVLLAVGSND